MKKIAAWGYGSYGRQMISAVDSFWKDEVEIVRIYDRRFFELSGEDPRLADPANMQKEFESGLFSAVMISVAWDNGEMKEKLKRYGISTYMTAPPDFYHSGTDFVRVEEPKITVRQNGYDFFVFRNLCGTPCLAPSTGIMFLFDEQGRALQEHWYSRRSEVYCTHQYDLPLRIDRPLPETVPMPGDWCVLAKLWSPNYWHFTFESMDCVQLLEEAGFTGKYVIGNESYNRELMLLYGIPEERIRVLHDFEPRKAYRFEQVYYPKLIRYDRICSAPVVERVSAHIRQKLKLEPGCYPSRLFVERNGTRKLLNSSTFLEKYGFTSIDPGKLPVWEQMQFFYNADIVLSPHGANSTNSIYMRPGTVFIETFSNKWVQYCCNEVLYRSHVFYLPVVQGPVMPRIPTEQDMFEDYRMPETNLFNAIDIAIFLHDAVGKGCVYADE